MQSVTTESSAGGLHGLSWRTTKRSAIGGTGRLIFRACQPTYVSQELPPTPSTFLVHELIHLVTTDLLLFRTYLSTQLRFHHIPSLELSWSMAASSCMYARGGVTSESREVRQARRGRHENHQERHEPQAHAGPDADDQPLPARHRQLRRSLAHRAWRTALRRPWRRA